MVGIEVAAGGGVRVGLAKVGSMVGVAGWLVAQAAINGTDTAKPIQRLFIAKWNRTRQDGNSADHPASAQS